MVWYCSDKCKKYCSIVGAHFVMVPLSFAWMYGNLSAYMDSYSRYACAPECMDGDSQWTLGMCLAMICPGTLITKKFADKIGLRIAGVISAIILNASIFATAWIVKTSVVGTTVLFGLVTGLVQGVTSVVVFEYVSGWAPEKAPLFMATTSGFASLVSIFHNQVITAVVNPNNLKPDAVQGSRTFFSQPDILNRVPMAIIVYGAINCGFQFVGYLLLAPQPKPCAQAQSLNAGDKQIHNARNGGFVTLQEVSSIKLLQPSEIQTNVGGYEDYGSNQGLYDNPTANSTKNIADKNVTDSLLIVNTKSLTPFQVLKTPAFYAFFFFGFATMYGLMLKSNFYKQFGLLYIQNDRYLTLVGTLIPVVACTSRTIFGAALNKNLITIKDSVVFSLAVNSALCSFWFLVPQVNEVLYMFLLLGLASVQSLFYMILPVASLYLFGPDHFSTNYGLLLGSSTVAGILSPVAITPLMEILGWFWLFGSASILCLVVLAFVVCTDIAPQTFSS